MTFRADLHCHSSCSDGSLSPAELLHHAFEVGLKGLSITDHDNYDAYVTAFTDAKKEGVELIPGIEFSAIHEGLSVHILGYSFKLNHPTLQALCQSHIARRDERNRAILENLAKLNMPLTMEELHPHQEKARIIGRPHIAQAMLKRGYVNSIQDAFKRYIGEGKPAYTKGAPISVEETLATLHEAQGLAIIAHPHLIESSKLLKRLLEMPFDGIECYYSRFLPESNAPLDLPS